MKLGSLAPAELAQRLQHGDLVLKAGPFNYRLQSRLTSIAEGLSLLYANYPLAEAADFADFSLKLEPGAGVHRWWRPQVRFSSDGFYPFEPLPITHAYPQMEWAMNWCVSTQAHQYLMLHAAVVERGGFAAILPAPPGSGKSTLCAALIHRGWRLLSDELALIKLIDGAIYPAARPVSLKNESMAIIQSFAPQAVFNQVTHNTSKGSVTHMRVPDEQVDRMQQTAAPRWVVFPKYVAHAAAELTPLSRGQSMLELGANAFNYTLLGLTGFNALADMVERSTCFRLHYSRLDDAINLFEHLAAQSGLAGAAP
jgi:HprK-related kinase A